MDFRDYVGIARKWLWLFVLASAVAGVSAFVATLGMPKQYRSQATVVIGRPEEIADPNANSIYITQSLAKLYADIANREPVLTGAVARLGVDWNWQVLRGIVRSSPVAGSHFVEIQAIDTDGARAQAIAQAVADELVARHGPQARARGRVVDETFVQEQIDTLQTKIMEAEDQLDDIRARIGLATSARQIADLEAQQTALERQVETWGSRLATYMTAVSGSETNSLAIIEDAIPGHQVGPNVRMNVLFAIAIGFGLALGAVLLLEYMDDTVKTEDALKRRTGLTGLATVERMASTEHRRDTLVTLTSPRSPAAEAYRVLRTNLNFSLLANDSSAIVVTSANPGEGKSTTAANLGVVAAQSGKRVVLVDSDLRRPTLHRYFGLPNSSGMTSLLLDPELDLDDVLVDIDDVPGLRVMTSGPLPPNPAEVLESARARNLIGRLREVSDLVVLDSPPLLVVTDGAVLASETEATLLVTQFGTTRNDSVKKALEVLVNVGVKPIGAVINMLDMDKAGYYYYRYYGYRYRYSEYYGDHNDGDESDGGSSEGGTHRTSGRKRPRQGLVGRVVDAVTSQF